MLTRSNSHLLHSSHSSTPTPLREYLYRLFHPQHMDFQFAYSQIASLLLSPTSMYKTTLIRHTIKYNYARDDPAFACILLTLFFTAALAYTAAFGAQSVSHMIRLLLGSVLIEFALCAIVVSLFAQWLANNYFHTHRRSTLNQRVSFLYAFDVHCNSLLHMFVLLGVVQYYLVPLLLCSDSIFICLLSNTLYAIALMCYLYCTFLGYSILPFLQRTERILYVAMLILPIWALSVMLRINFSHLMLELYFGTP